MINEHDIYVKAAEKAKIGIWEINIETNEIYWDLVTKKILEVPEDYKPVRGCASIYFSEGEIRERFQMLIQKAIEEGIPFSEKFQITTAKNNIKYVECICQVQLKNDTPSLLIGTFQDITKECNLIQKLELSIEKFSSVFSNANDAIIIIDSSTGIITDCNSRIYDLTGYKCAELVGLHNSKLFPDDQRNDVYVFLTKQLKKNSYFVKETYLKTKKGTQIPVEVASGKKFIVGNQTYLVCFFRDISQRKTVEENLSILSLAVSETTDAIVIINTEGETVWANNAYIKLTGFSMKELLGERPRNFLNGPETDLETLNKMRMAIKNKENIKTVILNYNKQKEKYWFEANMTPVFDNKGNCVKFVCVGRDVTSEKEKELKLQRILEVTSQQNKKLFNFAHIVSHNIRSHASNLSMVLDIMENSEDINEKLSYIELFKEGTEKLSETIEYLNEIITIQKNSNIEKKSVYLKDEIEKTKMVLKLPILESQIKISHSIPEDLTVNVIPAYLESILLNLFTNAIKYRSRDRITTLEIGYEINEEYTIINFKDNGLGIDLNKNGHKIFGMYKTFHGNHDARGIGLFITKNQIEAMKGKIEVESEEGTGSIFKIYLNEK